MRAKVWFGALLCSVTAACAAQESSAKVVPAPEQIALAVRIDALAAKLARSPVAATGNLCFSPSAVAATLAMLQPGMKDPVRARIDGALLAEGEDLAGALASLRAPFLGLVVRGNVMLATVAMVVGMVGWMLGMVIALP